MFDLHDNRGSACCVCLAAVGAETSKPIQRTEPDDRDEQTTDAHAAKNDSGDTIVYEIVVEKSEINHQQAETDP
jgi:hypothetical protein